MRILAILCSASFTPRLTANVHLAERRGSKHDEGALEEKYTGARREAAERNKREEGRTKRSWVQEALTSSGVQRSLYGQAIFTTKPPGRAEVTREVTSVLSTCNTRRYSHSPPGKKEWLVKSLLRVRRHAWRHPSRIAIRESLSRKFLTTLSQTSSRDFSNTSFAQRLFLKDNFNQKRYSIFWIPSPPRFPRNLRTDVTAETSWRSRLITTGRRRHTSAHAKRRDKAQGHFGLKPCRDGMSMLFHSRLRVWRRSSRARVRDVWMREFL